MASIIFYNAADSRCTMTTSGGTLSLCHSDKFSTFSCSPLSSGPDTQIRPLGLDVFSKTKVIFDNVAITISKLQAATSTAIPNVSFGCLQSASSYQHGVAIQP